VVADLVKNSKKVTSNEEIAQVGTISSNGDAEIGKFLADVVEAKKAFTQARFDFDDAKAPFHGRRGGPRQLAHNQGYGKDDIGEGLQTNNRMANESMPATHIAPYRAPAGSRAR
jgi:hypothetical protein